jgi:hypothetical protein
MSTTQETVQGKEYTDFKEYLDGIVKGDQEQMRAYINACLEVKAKYPKPNDGWVVVDLPPPPELTLEEKLANAGLSIEELKGLLGL